VKKPFKRYIYNKLASHCLSSITVHTLTKYLDTHSRTHVHTHTPSHACIFIRTHTSWNRESSVLKATGYTMDDQGIEVGFPKVLRLALESCRKSTGALTPEIKRLAHEADHMPPPSEEMEAFLQYPTRLHGVLVNYLPPETILSFLPLMELSPS
jgi:hypothetical protein